MPLANVVNRDPVVKERRDDGEHRGNGRKPERRGPVVESSDLRNCLSVSGLYRHLKARPLRNPIEVNERGGKAHSNFTHH